MIILVYLFFVFQIINIENLIGKSFVIGGFPAWTWLIYLFYIICYIFVFVYMLEKNDSKDMQIRVFVFTSAVIIVHFASIIHGSGINVILKESYHYVIPVFMYAVLYRCKYDYKKFWVFLKYLVLCNLLISVAFVTGILKLFFNTSYISLLSRSSTLIDGGLGVVALAVGLYCLFYDNDYYGKKDSWFLIISGVIITVSSQSRARLLTAILVFISFLFLSNIGKTKKQGKRFSWVNMGILVFAVLIISYLFISNSTDSIFSQIGDRFSIIGSDNSSIYRVYEREKQISIFLDHPIFGAGWGAYQNVYVNDTAGIANSVNNHNMYTTILGYGGIVLALAYIIWVVGLIKSIMSNYLTNSAEKLNIILLLSILILSFGSAGFGKSSMILAITIIYININHYKFTDFNEGRRKLK